MRLLIDECLSIELVKVGIEAGHETHHVAHKGMSGWQDRKIAPVVIAEGFTFVTNNADDFRKLYGKAEIHAGLIIIVPQVSIETQKKIFKQVLKHLRQENPINHVVEVRLEGNNLVIDKYSLPPL